MGGYIGLWVVIEGMGGYRGLWVVIYGYAALWEVCL